MFSKEQFTTVTPLSKALALVVFIVLPFVAFFLGMNYGQQSVPPAETLVFPTTDNDIEQDGIPRDIAKVDTSSWVTYRNNPAGFEIDIPENWGELSTFDGSWSPIDPERTDYTALGDADGSDTLVLEINVNNQNLKSIDDYLSFRLKTTDYTLVKRENLSVRNGSGERITFIDSSGSTKYEYVFAKSESVVVSFSFIDELDTVGDTVASTFRFID